MDARRGIGAIVTGAIVASLFAGGTAAGQDPSPSPTASASASPSIAPSAAPSPTGPPGPPRQILLAFDSPAPSDPSRPCTSGNAFKWNIIGDVDSLVVCTFDEAGNPSPTDSDGTHLVWWIETVYPSSPQPVRFFPDPPTETSNAAGATASAEIQAVIGGEATVVVELRTFEGYGINRASVGKRVHENHPPPHDVPLKVKAKRADGAIHGRLFTEKQCRRQREVRLYRRGRWADNLRWVRSAFTDRRGRWRVGVDRPGVYQVRVGAIYRYSEGASNCLHGASKEIRMRYADL